MRPGWVRFESAHPLKVGQDSAGVDNGVHRSRKGAHTDFLTSEASGMA